jgi:hypothetical protein
MSNVDARLVMSALNASEMRSPFNANKATSA